MADLPIAPRSLAANSPFSAGHEAIFVDIRTQARHASMALSSVIELLSGCDPRHPVCAGKLAALLAPVASELDMINDDLYTAMLPGALQ